MNCPKCGKEMRLGSLEPAVFDVCWYPDVKPPYMGENSYVNLPMLDQAYYCRDCYTLVLPAQPPEETEGLFKTLGDKWRSRKQEKEAGKKKTKDPWEV